MIIPDGPSIEYQAETKILDLMEEYCGSNKKAYRIQRHDQAVLIRYYLNAVALYKDYITDTEINNIYEKLKDAAGLSEFPTPPSLPVLAVPTVGTGPAGPQGEQGERGEDGGGTDFIALNIAIDTVVDEFDITDAYAARWDYIVNGDAQRAGTVWGTWTEDGGNITYHDFSTTDINGATDDVTFQVDISGTTVRLMAIITGGQWTVAGSRYFIPNNGAGTGPVTSVLEDGKIFIGNSSNVATAQAVTGDISITNGGVASITPNVIVNGDVSPTAAIAVSKLAAMTASRAVTTDASGFLTTSSVTSTELGYLSGVTSSIQSQLDSKLGGATGAISTVTSTNLTASRVVISNPSGKIAASSVTTTELGYLSGVTSAIQTQLNSKIGAVTTGTVEIQGGIRTQNSGPYLKVKVLDIGNWNMSSTSQISVNHGITDFTKIRMVEAMIIGDSGVNLQSLNGSDSSGSGTGRIVVASTQLFLSRAPGGVFDGTDHDHPSINRGWVTIWYEA